MDIENTKEQPLINHLIELRSRILRAGGCVIAVFILLLPFTNQIYVFIATPLMEKLPAGSSMIATEVASPFIAPFKLGLFAAIFISMPYILHQIWKFISPGLYKNEKKITFPILVSSITLFYVGTSFAYFLVFPLLFSFLSTIGPEGVKMMTDINSYLNFVLKLFFAFGLSFEIPVATFLLVCGNFVSVKNLANKRAYVIVAAFLLGMLLTPPDPLSQIFLAMPIWVLFEVGLILSSYWEKKQHKKTIHEQ